MTERAEKLDKKYSLCVTLQKEIEATSKLICATQEICEMVPGTDDYYLKKEQQKRDSLIQKRNALVDEMIKEFSLTGDAKLEAILVMRYIAGLEWSMIGAEIGHEKRYVMRLRDSALDKIAEELEKLTPKDISGHMT